MCEKRYLILILFSLLVTLIIVFLSIFMGQQKISLENVLSVLLAKDKESINFLIIKKIRIPRILASLLVGIALSTSGAVLQGIFENPLASPYLLGISNGAGFMASVGFLLGLHGFLLQLFAFSGGIVAVFLAILLSSFFKQRGSISIIIGGILIGNFFAALTMYVKLIADPLAKLPSIVYWLMGSFINVTQKSIYIPSILILSSTFFLVLLSWKLTILSYGDIHSRTLGENPLFLKLIAIFLTTISTSAAISIGGVIGWIGVVIPQIARLRFGNDFRKLLLISAIWGAAFTCAMDSIARIFLRYELPVGLISSVIGIPFSIIILTRKGNDYN